MHQDRPQTNFWTRLTLCLALVMAQSLALAHEQDHDWLPDTLVCDSCLNAQNLDQSLAVDSDRAPIGQQPNRSEPALDMPALLRRAFTSIQSRAPPPLPR